MAQNESTKKWGLIETDANYELSLTSGKKYALPQKTLKIHEVIWQSMNTDIVTIENGKLVPNTPGRTSIILYNNTTDTNTTWMIDVKVPAKSINLLSKSSAALKIDKRGTLLPESSYTPLVYLVSKVPRYAVDEKALIYTLKFPKNQEPSCYLDKDNNVWAIQYGKATLTITEPISGKKKNVNIKTYELPNDVKITHKNAVPATSPSIASSKITIGLGKSVTLKASISNSKYVHKDDRIIMWRTSDVNVARVSNKGKVTRVGPGRCYITAYTSNGVYDIIEIDDGSGGSIAPPMRSVQALLSPALNVPDAKLTSFIKDMNIMDVTEKENKLHLEVNGNSSWYRIPFDKYIANWLSDEGKDFQYFVQNVMYPSDNITGLSKENADTFAEAIECALNEAIEEYNNLNRTSISYISTYITSDMRFAAYMESDTPFYFPTCETVESVGHLFLHLFCDFGTSGKTEDIVVPLFE